MEPPSAPTTAAYGGLPKPSSTSNSTRRSHSTGEDIRSAYQRHRVRVAVLAGSIVGAGSTSLPSTSAATSQVSMHLNEGYKPTPSRMRVRWDRLESRAKRPSVRERGNGTKNERALADFRKWL